MEYREFGITLISAKNLEDVRIFRRMRVYATVSIGGGAVQWTPTSDKRCASNPSWNCTMWFPVSEWMLKNYNTMLVVKLYCERSFGDRYVGEVHMPIKELFDGKSDAGGRSPMSFQVLNGGAHTRGTLAFSYTFGRMELYYGR